jgi:hypothetical protein
MMLQIEELNFKIEKAKVTQQNFQPFVDEMVKISKAH